MAELKPFPTISWNPCFGCTPIDAGCLRCFAARNLLAAEPNTPLVELRNGIPTFTGLVRPEPNLLNWPLEEKKPQIIFAFSDSDPFHHHISDAFIDCAGEVMRRADWHQFNLLTKRVDGLAKFAARKPIPENVRIGFSCHDQDSLDERWAKFRDIPAMVRHISVEPMLGPCVIREHFNGWVVVMAECGKGGRPLRPEWVRDLRASCEDYQVPFFWELSMADGEDNIAERRRALDAGTPYRSDWEPDIVPPYVPDFY